VKAEERRRLTYGLRVRAVHDRLANGKTLTSSVDLVREDRLR
jgi:hypothetical protein